MLKMELASRWWHSLGESDGRDGAQTMHASQRQFRAAYGYVRCTRMIYLPDHVPVYLCLDIRLLPRKVLGVKRRIKRHKSGGGEKRRGKGGGLHLDQGPKRIGISMRVAYYDVFPGERKV